MDQGLVVVMICDDMWQQLSAELDAAQSGSLGAWRAAFEAASFNWRAFTWCKLLWRVWCDQRFASIHQHSFLLYMQLIFKLLSVVYAVMMGGTRFSCTCTCASLTAASLMHDECTTAWELLPFGGGCLESFAWL